MQEWKAAGPAPKDVDDALWKRFRGAQDVFFGARDAANAEIDREFAANAEEKEELLAEAEALLPVTDLAAAKRAFRDIAERWDAAGKVPRDQMKPLEARIRKVEQEIRGLEDGRVAQAATRRSPPAPTTWSAKLARGDRQARGRPGEGPRRRGRQGGSRSSRTTSPRVAPSWRWPRRPPPSSADRRPARI